VLAGVPEKAWINDKSPGISRKLSRSLGLPDRQLDRCPDPLPGISVFPWFQPESVGSRAEREVPVYDHMIGGRDVVAGHKIDTTSGERSVLPDSPTELDFNPRSLAIAPKGRFVYVTEMGGSKTAAFQVNEASGELTAIAGSPPSKYLNTQGY
jgi:hypothetical protein